MVLKIYPPSRRASEGKQGNGRLLPLSGGGKSGHHPVFGGIKKYGLTARRGINNARGANRDDFVRNDKIALSNDRA